jgi:rhamnosyltransferase subunit B
MKLRILFAPFGSEGDMNPLFWLAEGLAARGHEPVFLLSPHYGRHAESRGFTWFPVGTEEHFTRFAHNPDLWHAYRGPSLVVQGMLDSLPFYREAFARAGSRFDLVVTSSFAFAASSLAEAAGLPQLTLHLQPICLRSDYESPLFLPELSWLNRMPRWVKRLFYFGVDFTLWRMIEGPLNAFRAQLQLPPLRRFYDEAVNGAEAVAALFPEWFAAAQPDWPGHLRQFGFPVKHSAPHPFPPGLARFLEAGEPPVVWTHGSANFHMHEFQECALRVSQELGLRSLLVSLTPPAVTLPDSAFHCSHVRFEDLFPHCRAAVHHGGIGTTAKCIAAGIPQLIIPRSHDQPDNARRIARLGLGDTVSYRRIRGPRVPRVLQNLLTSPSVAERCREFQNRMVAADPLTSLCEWAEETASRNSPPVLLAAC